MSWTNPQGIALIETSLVIKVYDADMKNALEYINAKHTPL